MVVIYQARSVLVDCHEEGAVSWRLECSSIGAKRP